MIPFLLSGCWNRHFLANRVEPVVQNSSVLRLQCIAGGCSKRARHEIASFTPTSSGRAACQSRPALCATLCTKLLPSGNIYISWDGMRIALERLPPLNPVYATSDLAGPSHYPPPSNVRRMVLKCQRQMMFFPRPNA